MNNQPIGILDSGVGGLSIWRNIISELPHENTVYVADSAHCPYGPRSTEEICQLARGMIQFLLSHQVKLIVIACNTITVSCLDALRKEFPQTPIIGTVPVIKTAAEVSKNKKIGVLSTTRTAASEYQQELIQRFAHDCEVVKQGTDRLVPFIEAGDVVSEEFLQILREELQPFQEKQVDTVALACTHYPFAQKAMETIMGAEVKFLDPGPAIARHVRRVLTNNEMLGEGQATHHFYTTGEKEQFEKTVNSLIGYNVGQGVAIDHAAI